MKWSFETLQLIIWFHFVLRFYFMLYNTQLLVVESISVSFSFENWLESHTLVIASPPFKLWNLSTHRCAGYRNVPWSEWTLISNTWSLGRVRLLQNGALNTLISNNHWLKHSHLDPLRKITHDTALTPQIGRTLFRRSQNYDVLFFSTRYWYRHVRD